MLGTRSSCSSGALPHTRTHTQLAGSSLARTLKRTYTPPSCIHAHNTHTGLDCVVPWRIPEFYTKFQGRADLLAYAKVSLSLSLPLCRSLVLALALALSTYLSRVLSKYLSTYLSRVLSMYLSTYRSLRSLSPSLPPALCLSLARALSRALPPQHTSA